MTALGQQYAPSRRGWMAQTRRERTFNADPWSIDCTRPIGNIGRAILL